MTKIYFKLEYKHKTIELIVDNVDNLENYLFRVYGLNIEDNLFSNSPMIVTNHKNEKYYPYVSKTLCI